MQDLSGQRYVWRVLPGQRKETPNQLLEEARTTWKKLIGNEVEPGVAFEQWLETQKAEYPLPASSNNDTGAPGPDNQKQSPRGRCARTSKKGPDNTYGRKWSCAPASQSS